MTKATRQGDVLSERTSFCYVGPARVNRHGLPTQLSWRAAPVPYAHGMAKHEWRERTESGEQRSVRASHHAGKWTLESRLKSETGWTRLDPVPLDDLRELLDVIERKYQRGRLPHDQVVKLRELIEEREELEE